MKSPEVYHTNILHLLIIGFAVLLAFKSDLIKEVTIENHFSLPQTSFLRDCYSFIMLFH
jgi:hypothetical protein